MTAGEVAVVIAAVLGSGGLGTWVHAIYSRRQGISADERSVRRDAAEDRRDAIAERDGLIDRIERRLVAVEFRLSETEDDLVAVRRELRLERAYTESLIQHIGQGLGPPPPPRPEG